MINLDKTVETIKELLSEVKEWHIEEIVELLGFELEITKERYIVREGEMIWDNWVLGENEYDLNNLFNEEYWAYDETIILLRDLREITVVKSELEEKLEEFKKYLSERLKCLRNTLEFEDSIQKTHDLREQEGELIRAIFAFKQVFEEEE